MSQQCYSLSTTARYSSGRRGTEYGDVRPMYAAEFADSARVTGLLSPAQVREWNARRVAMLVDLQRRLERGSDVVGKIRARRGPTPRRWSKAAA